MTTLSQSQDKRKQKTNKQKVNPLSVLTAIMIASLAILFSMAKPVLLERRKLKAPVIWECKLCHFLMEDDFNTSPRQCPKCKEKAFYITAFFKCLECGTEFEAYKIILSYNKRKNTDKWTIMTLSGEIIDPMDLRTADFCAEIRCPQCNSAHLKSVDFIELPQYVGQK
ncbi:MAG: hypothetical protein KAI03_03110 [Candidatus Aureabacteria bacterium]|nr:hypothetical protein [Candidatus Auribacterota bacterium]